MADHTAVDSTLGFVYQSLQALLLLMDAEDESSVSIEVLDDVAIHDPNVDTDAARYQLAHTLSAAPTPIAINNQKLWKTLGIWMSEPAEHTCHIFMTCAGVEAPLACLTDGSDRSQLLSLLVKEAQKVIQEKVDGRYEHKIRYPASKALIDMAPTKREAFLKSVHIYALQPNILQADQQIANRLEMVGPATRDLLVRRIREFWANRLHKALTREMPCRVPKIELQSFIEETTVSLRGNTLPSDFEGLAPPDDAGAPDVLRQQIELVSGGTSRVNRARVAHWRSQSQRQRWMEERVAFKPALDAFDAALTEAWQDRHGPLCDDCGGQDDAVKAKLGCSLLDWTHHEAPHTLMNVGRKYAPAYVVQGSFQELADRKEVGWHPGFRELLPKATKDES